MANSHLFLSSILVAAFLGIAFAEVTWLEGSIYCSRNNKWSPLEGATARVVCKAFTEDAATNKTGYFLQKLQDNTDFCTVTLERPGPNSDDCIVPDPKNSFDFAKVKYKNETTNITIYTTKPLLYNPRPGPFVGAIPTNFSANP